MQPPKRGFYANVIFKVNFSQKTGGGRRRSSVSLSWHYFFNTDSLKWNMDLKNVLKRDILGWTVITP